MSLKLATFPVEHVEFGEFTSWADGKLTINREELEQLALDDSSVKNVTIGIASPGESARVIHVTDVLEPRSKVDGAGIVYPGVCGRQVETVGTGLTHRLSGMCVVESSFQSSSSTPGGFTTTFTASDALKLPQNSRPQDFIDLSGPGAATPFASLINICVAIDLKDGVDDEDRHLANHSAILRISDALGNATKGLVAPSIELIDTKPVDRSLPGVVFICCLFSGEAYHGPDSKRGTAVYGATRLSAPWLLSAEEMIDGAVSQKISWHFTNNPIVRSLLDRHNKDLNFLGCIIQRTHWGGQNEMNLSSNRSAKIASMIGANGAIVSTNIRGRRFVDTVLCVKACEDLGIRTVLVTEEEDDENGTAPPLLVSTPEMRGVVSTGTGAVPGPFLPVERVLGARQGDDAWAGELPPIAGRYGAFHTQDFYGFGNQSREDY